MDTTIDINNGENQVMAHVGVANNFFGQIPGAPEPRPATMVDSDMEPAARDLCRALQLNPNRYTLTRIQGHEARIYSNRVTVISAGLDEIDLSEWVR